MPASIESSRNDLAKSSKSYSSESDLKEARVDTDKDKSMGSKDSGPAGGSKRPNGTTGRNRNAYCSFCKKSFRDVGPLVEGPGEVYICGECIELCQSIIDQEKRRRGATKALFTNIPSPRIIKDKLDQYVIGQQGAKKVLSVAVHNNYKGLSLGDEGHSGIRVDKSNIL